MVVIIGAGICGLAAASMLVREGIECMVVEAGARPGGRLHSFLDHSSGRVLDNGQHVLVEACKETLGWLGEIGVQDFPFLRVTSIPFRSTRGRQGMLPAANSVKLLAGLLGFGLLPPRSRLQAILHFWQLRRSRELSLRSALNEFGASAEGIRYLWEPLCRAFFCRNLEEVDVADFARLLDEFVRRPTLLIPTKSLADTFISPAVQFLSQNGVCVEYGARVRGWEVKNGRIGRLRLASGKGIPCKTVISTIPPTRLAALDAYPTTGCSSAIISVYFWCERMEAPPVTALVDSIGQWLFDKGGGLYQITISRAEPWLDVCDEELLAVLIAELNHCGMNAPARVRYRVIRTRQAIYHGARPHAAYSNLHISGDWTSPGLPGSIESAVRSARKVVNAILQGGQSC